MLQWKNFINNAKKFGNCSVVNLNEASDKEIYVMKFCSSDTVKSLLNLDSDVSSRQPLFIALIPNTSKIFVSLFCCNIALEDIYQKFSSFGLALEGCFNIEKITGLPNFYRGISYKDPNNMLTTQGQKLPTPTAYLILDNHFISKIIDETELGSYQPVGVNVQYIEGQRLYKQGKLVANASDNIVLVLATDADNNVFMVYHKYITVMAILHSFKCSDAILLCSSPNAHILWKKAGLNTYNLTDFIGDPGDVVSNVVTFSA